MPGPIDIYVKSANPKVLDETVQALGAAVVIEDRPGVYLAVAEDTYVVRAFSGGGYIRFAIANQGYGEIVEPPECPDGGACHHLCEAPRCFRVATCEPLSGVYPNDQWPDDILIERGGDSISYEEIRPKGDPIGNGTEPALTAIEAMDFAAWVASAPREVIVLDQERFDDFMTALGLAPSANAALRRIFKRESLIKREDK